MHPQTAPADPDPEPDPSSALAALLDRQAGVLTREQAVAAGLPPAAVDDRLRRRRWRPLHPRVYLARGTRPGPEAAARAALLWAGPGAVLSGPSAAWWHGLLAAPPPVPTVTVPGRRHRTGGAVAVRVRELGPADVAQVRGMPVTALPLTALEAALALGADGPALLDDALRTRVRFPAVLAAHRRTRGAPGAARAALLLDAAADRSAAQSVRLLAGLLRAAGLGGWRLAPGTARIAFPAAGVHVQLRGWAWPVTAPTAPAPGGRVLKYTWHDLVDRPSIVLAEIAGAVADRQGGHPAVISATPRGAAGHLREQARPRAGYSES